MNFKSPAVLIVDDSELNALVLATEQAARRTATRAGKRAGGTHEAPLRIVALTAADLEPSRTHCLDAGMQACYTRPVDLDELADIIALPATPAEQELPR